MCAILHCRCRFRSLSWDFCLYYRYRLVTAKIPGIQYVMIAVGIVPKGRSRTKNTMESECGTGTICATELAKRYGEGSKMLVIFFSKSVGNRGRNAVRM